MRTARTVTGRRTATNESAYESRSVRRARDSRSGMIRHPRLISQRPAACRNVPVSPGAVGLSPAVNTSSSNISQRGLSCRMPIRPYKQVSSELLPLSNNNAAVLTSSGVGFDTSTEGSSRISRSRLATSMPFSLGIPRSSRIRSGWSCSAFWTASKASDTCAMTSHCVFPRM